MEDATVAGSAGCVKGGGELELELELELCSGWNWIQQGTRSRTVFFFQEESESDWLAAADWVCCKLGRAQCWA